MCEEHEENRNVDVPTHTFICSERENMHIIIFIHIPPADSHFLFKSKAHIAFPLAVLARQLFPNQMTSISTINSKRRPSFRLV